jgi:hypothetical protein
MRYLLYFPDGSVMDAFRLPSTIEQDFINYESDKGAVKIVRRSDGIIVYEKDPAPTTKP